MQTDVYKQMSGAMLSGLLQGLKTSLFDFWYLWVFIGIVVLLKISLGIHKIYKLNKAGLPQIDKMSGEEFEMFLEQLFKRKGYRVERVGHVSDYGADLIIDKDGTKTAVQAKCWKNPVTVKAIQEINTSMAHYNAIKAMVVTNSRFTSNALTLAKENDVELIDRQRLASLILKKQ